MERRAKAGRVLAAAAVAAACLSLGAAGTLAYFAGSGTAHNVVTSGGVEIALDEWADEERTERFEDVSGVTPGSSVGKVVEVENTGSAPAWVRVKVEIGGDLGDEAARGLVAVDLNEPAWVSSGGWLYYAEPLAPGAVTAPAFTKVSFSEEMDSDWAGADVRVRVSAQAVQSDNNGSTVLGAAGWPEGGDE